ncbi:ribonuclease H-like domain-containing protein [Patescibacteria group bacterium]|nr:ribonuclease H-like domain-containing protein [Patescibacteria group bacterium]
MRKITLDIETTSAASHFDMSAMELSVVGTHDSLTDVYRAYTVPELPELWPILESADLLIGFNSDHFDIPILDRYYAGDLTRIRSLDLLVEVKKSLGRRIKLDSIAKATLGTRKSGHGLDAVTWWAEGKVEKVKKYCLDDVRITKQIYDYAREHKKLRFDDFGKKRDIPIDSDTWESVAPTVLTHTLPF